MISAGRVVIVCSPKTPRVRPELANFTRHYKYVIKAGQTSEVDGLPNVGTQPATVGKLQLLFRPPACDSIIWISPCDEYDPTKNLANVHAARDVVLKFGYRLSLQTHKLIGVE